MSTDQQSVNFLLGRGVNRAHTNAHTSAYTPAHTQEHKHTLEMSPAKGFQRQHQNKAEKILGKVMSFSCISTKIHKDSWVKAKHHAANSPFTLKDYCRRLLIQYVCLHQFFTASFPDKFTFCLQVHAADFTYSSRNALQFQVSSLQSSISFHLTVLSSFGRSVRRLAPPVNRPHLPRVTVHSNFMICPKTILFWIMEKYVQWLQDHYSLYFLTQSEENSNYQVPHTTCDSQIY